MSSLASFLRRVQIARPSAAPTDALPRSCFGQIERAEHATLQEFVGARPLPEQIPPQRPSGQD
jgi:hypothetical protein